MNTSNAAIDAARETKDRYAVFGNPISHSKSPLIHALFSEQTQQDISYTKQLVEKDQFASAANHFFSSGGKGLNITLPFKSDAFHFARQLSGRAQLAGAVNTLKIMPDGTLFGDNTDGCGLVSDILQNHQWQIFEKNILILGAGGAVRGVLHPLLAEKPASITIANRTIGKAIELARLFNPSIIKACEYDELPNASFDLIINGTSASLSNELPPLHNLLIDGSTHCYDMVYSRQQTLFLHWAQQQGCLHLADGLGMLVEQAAESFFIWRGIKPETLPVITKLRQEL